MDTKGILTSKTFYFGLLHILVAVAGVLGFVDYQPDANTVKIGASITGVAIILLRLVSDTKITGMR